MADTALRHVNSAAIPVDEAQQLADAGEKRLRRIVWVVALAFSVLLLWWGAQRPVFDIRRVQVSGELHHHDRDALAQRVLSEVQGNFFSTDLQQLSRWVKHKPWVRQAVVHRRFPDALVLHVSEHQGVALWGDEREGRLVNAFGEVFSAGVDSEQARSLPVFAGPDGMSAQVMSMYVTLNKVVAPLKSRIHRMELDDGGAWRMEMTEGARIELGRGSEEQLQLRLRRFVSSLAVVNRLDRPVGLALIDSVDLRYAKGYALRLRD